WGNITAGVELIRRIRAHRSGREVAETDASVDPVGEGVYGLTHPLVMKADGAKFGKSESGTVWLSEDRTSANQLYQCVVQTSDADVGAYLRYLTFPAESEILRLDETVRSAPERREAQTKLAAEVVRIVHGESALERAIQASSALFGTEIRNLPKP